jgi:hypothetical protein
MLSFATSGFAPAARSSGWKAMEFRRTREIVRQWVFVLSLLAVLFATGGAPAAFAQTAAPVSCARFAPPVQQAAGHTVGITQCDIVSETKVADSRGKAFVRMEIAISGSVFGYVPPATVGITRKDITDEPELLYPQFGVTKWVPGVATYAGGNDAKGAGLTILYPDPAAKTPWNGKVYFVVHGSANNMPMGPLVPVASDGFTQKTFTNLYARQMMDKGYAVIYTRRPAGGGVKATLDDGKGTVLNNETITDHVGMLLDFFKLGKGIITARLGKAPATSYWYGHSAGVIVGRLINYTGRNWDPNGKRYFDGFFMDDPGGGLPLPVLLGKDEVFGQRDGRVTYNPADVLFATPAAKAKFTREINLAHAAYLSTHDWIPDVSFLTLKRQAALILHQHGMDDMSVTYEIGGVSHFPNQIGSADKTLDIGPIADSVLGLLDAWVQRDIPPPPTIANLAALGTGGAYAAEHTQILQLPPIACPTGVRYFYGPAPAGQAFDTGYAPFDGTSLEPVDSRGVLVDVNGDGYRDKMPTIDEAWINAGLIGAGQAVDEPRYARCVASSTRALVDDRLITPASAGWYNAQAKNYPNVPW